jgi:serine/threonine protein kinase
MNKSVLPDSDSPSSTTADEELLADLADDFAARLRRGEHPLVEEYVAKHPALAERIRNVFSAAAMMEQTREFHTAPAGERPGTVIGRYKLLERIGEGGFGVVYMAEQQHPVRRKVALKVVKPGMDSRQVLARFEAERQALAIMDHPNIAKVFDGGMTDFGRPYFVMDLIKGEPITEYCDLNQLPPRKRLELFLQVCSAVQHAHQKGIIHRDIKPSNLLVMMHDTTPVVKVIDFGVAKALGQELTDKTLFTGFAQFLGTPLYMSPEQAGQSALDVDTRSDIYSLGVLLYELLTGTTPFDKERFRKAADDEIRRIIREEEPPKPSTRLSESKESLPSISAQRHMEPAKLTKLVRGELDWIVMKALEKDRARRYETASGLARDVERYLRDETVQACPPSLDYRLRKFIHRHRVGLIVATVAAAFILVIAGSIGWNLRDRAAKRAELERNVQTAMQQAENLSDDANVLFALALAQAKLGNREQARTRYDRAVAMTDRPYMYSAGLRVMLIEVAGLLNVEDVHVAVARGRSDILFNRWEQAYRQYVKLGDWTGRGDMDRWFERACGHLLVGDVVGYRQLCGRIIPPDGTEMNGRNMFQLLRICALRPDSPLGSKRISKLADCLLTAEQYAWSLHVAGLAYYRAGENENAINAVERSNGERWDTHAKALNWLVLAMAHNRLHHESQARNAWKMALQLIEEASRGAGQPVMAMHPADWAEIQVLLDEARDVLRDIAGGQGWERELAELTRNVERNPEDAQAYRARGKFLVGADRLPEAIADFDKAMQLDPVEPG